MQNDMTRGNPLKLFLYFSVPLLIGNIFQQLYSMVDTIIVGRFVGENALAAVGSTGSMFFLVNGFLVGLTSGFSVLVSQRFGAKDEEGIKKAVASNIVLTLLMTAIVTLLMTVATKPLLHLMNTPENVFEDAHTYISIIFMGIFTQSLYNMVAGILRAFGDSRTPLYFLVVSSIINIVLDLVFIINFDMGVAGAAHATNVAQGISAILCIVYSYKRYSILRLKKEDFKGHKAYNKIHFSIGVPMALQFSITAIGIMMLQSAINVFGSTVMAAYTAASKVLQLFMQPLVTYGVAIATFAGQNLGAGNYARIRQGVRVISIVAIITSILGGIAMIVFGETFVSLFIENPTKEILDYAQQVLNYAGVFTIPLGLIFVYRNALQGIGYSFIPMLGGIVELIARGLVAFILPAHIGFAGICLADPAAWIVACILLAGGYFWQIRALPQERSQVEDAVENAH